MFLFNEYICMKKSKRKNHDIIVDKTDTDTTLQDIRINRHGVLIALGIVTLLLLFIFHNFITGRFYYLFNDIARDSILSNFPNALYVSRFLRTEGFPLWSFAQGLGQNIMAASLSDPFYWIVYLAGDANAPYSVIWMEIVKIILTAVAIYHFFKLWDFSTASTIIGTLLYCFSGFMFVGGQWWVFSTEGCFLAILLLSFEKLYRQNSWYLFPLAVALIAIHNPFELYTSSLFLLVYFLFRHFSSEKPKANIFFSLLTKMFFLGLLGIMMSCFSLTANIQRIIDSPRVGDDFSYFHALQSTPIFSLEHPEHYITALLRFFSNDLMGNGITYSGWHNYLEAPLFYIGLLPLLLLPQIFTLFKLRRLIVYISFFTVFIIPIIFPYFRYAFFLFSGDYYRAFSFFTSLSFLFLGLIALKEIENRNTVNVYILLGTFLTAMVIIYFPYHANITNINISDGTVAFHQNTNRMISINPTQRFAISILLITYTVFIFLFKFIRLRPLVNILLLAVVTIEIGYMNATSLNSRAALSDWDMTAFTDGCTKDAVSHIQVADKGFYRINMDPEVVSDTRFLLNKAKVQGYFGTTCYDSFNQKHYIRFLKELDALVEGYDGGTRLCYGLMTRPLLWSFASIKYYIGTHHEPMELLQLGFNPVKTIGNIAIYQNSNFLPLGYTYDQYVPASKFRSLSYIQKQIVLQKAVVLEEPIPPEIKHTLKLIDLVNLSKNYTTDSYAHDIAELNHNIFNIIHFSQNDIEGTIMTGEPKILFFSIPFDKGWRAVIDNTTIAPRLCNIGFIGFFLEPGYHTIKLTYAPPYFLWSLTVSVLGLMIYFALAAVHVLLPPLQRRLQEGE